MSFSFGQSKDKGSENFSRHGTTFSTKRNARPPWLTRAGSSVINNAQPKNDLGLSEEEFLQALMTKDWAHALPGQDVLGAIYSENPNDFFGIEQLKSQASIDPYSDAYKTGVEGLYQGIFEEAVANARTGPDAVSGGAAHGAMAAGTALDQAARNKFREITGLQMQQAGNTREAIQLLQSLLTAKDGASMTAQDQAVRQLMLGNAQGLEAVQSLQAKRAGAGSLIGGLSDNYGEMQANTRENVDGKGTNTSSHQGWNTGFSLGSCCFIFMEAVNGPLPWYCRRARDLFVTPDARRGYNRMARWLVPLMQRSRVVRWLTNALMVKPLLAYGAWLFHSEERRFYGRWLAPVFAGWFCVWSKIGKA